MLNYDEFNRLIRTKVKENSTVSEDSDILVIYQNSALNVQKGVGFDGIKFFVVTYENGTATVDIYEKTTL